MKFLYPLERVIWCLTMRRQQKADAAAQAAVLPRIPPEFLDQFVKGPMTAEAVQEASTAFKKALIERDAQCPFRGG